jgi:hypothetical protein
VDRKQVDIRKCPVWIQYTIALIVTAIVVAIALKFGDPDDIPLWVKKYFIPAIVFIGLIVLSHKIFLFLKKLFK